MNAIILAAGQGKRLAPLTEHKPKCMVNLFGKTLLEWQISVFKKCGISDITIVTGYRHELIDFNGLTFFQNNLLFYKELLVLKPCFYLHQPYLK